MIKSNKYLGGLAVVLASLTLLACNGGGGSSGGGLPPQQEYQLGPYSDTGSKTGCLLPGVFNSQCSAKSSTVTFNVSYETTPASYLVIPLQSSLPSGLTISQTGTCSTSPVASYSCSFTWIARNTVSGTTVNIPLSGSLGTVALYSVTFQ